MIEDQGSVRQARDSEGRRAGPGLARELSELARVMQAEPAVPSLPRRIVGAAAVNVPGAEHAGITIVRSKTLRSPDTTGDLVERVDAVQYETGQGPCVQAGRKRVTIRSDDLRVDPRWPRFSSRAVELGIVSMISVQLFVATDSYGALNLYSSGPDTFNTESERAAMLFASHAALAMKAADTEVQLRVALGHRDVIGQAKGILMER